MRRWIRPLGAALALAATAACGGSEAEHAMDAGTDAAAGSSVEAKLARYTPVRLTADLGGLSGREPKLVAQIEFTEWTKANHLRHSRFAGLLEDKSAADVRRESAS